MFDLKINESRTIKNISLQELIIEKWYLVEKGNCTFKKGDVVIRPEYAPDGLFHIKVDGHLSSFNLAHSGGSNISTSFNGVEVRLLTNFESITLSNRE